MAGVGALDDEDDAELHAATTAAAASDAARRAAVVRGLKAGDMSGVSVRVLWAIG